MNAVEIITKAAEQAEADLYSPAQRGDRNSDAYALVRRADPGQVLMVNADDVVEGYAVTVYAYLAPNPVYTASDVMPALVTTDGASVDPVAEGAVVLTPTDPANDVVAAMASASDGADLVAEGKVLAARVNRFVNGRCKVSIIPTHGESFVAVSLYTEGDLGIIVSEDGAITVEGLTDQPEPFETLAAAVDHVLAGTE